jgi:hypothetical protein
VSTRHKPDGLIDVQLLGMPLALYRQASEHNDDLRREFALIHSRGPDQASVPARLLLLIDELGERFAVFTAEPNAALHDALARGDDRIDLGYRMPPQAKEAFVTLGALLDEADDYCRTGGSLLTMATPPGPLAFRRWVFGEFVAQLEGGEPTTWDRFDSGA